MRTVFHSPQLSRPAGLCWLLALAAGCVSTSEGEIAPLREEVSALRQAHDSDRKRLEALEVQVDAQQMELRHLRGDTPDERGSGDPASAAALPVVRLQPQGSRTAPALPTEVKVHEPPVEVVAELERAHARATDDSTGSAGSKEEADRLFDVAFEKLKTGELVGAASLFRDFARRYPHHPAADNALLDEGIAFYGLRQYQQALEVFEALTKRYPAGDAITEARLRAGDCQIKLGDLAAAQATLHGIVTIYPGSPEATKAAAQLSAIENKPGEKRDQAEDLAKTEGDSE
jgi:TolA-binding protein